MLLLVSCVTSPNPPKLSLPDFPDPQDPPVVKLEDGIVSMPDWYWFKIVDFAVEVDTIFKSYEIFQKDF